MWVTMKAGIVIRKVSITNFSHQKLSGNDHLLVSLLLNLASIQFPQQYPKHTLTKVHSISIWKLTSFKVEGTTSQWVAMLIRMGLRSMGLGRQRQIMRGTRTMKMCRKNIQIIIAFPFLVQFVSQRRNVVSKSAKQSFQRRRAVRLRITPSRTWFTETIPRQIEPIGMEIPSKTGSKRWRQYFPSPTKWMISGSKSRIGVIAEPEGFPQSQWQVSLRFNTLELLQNGLGSAYSDLSTIDTQIHPRKYMR